MKVMLEGKFTFEIDESVMDCDSFKDAMDKGAVKLLTNETKLSNEHGDICDDDVTHKEIVDAMIYGLRERT